MGLYADNDAPLDDEYLRTLAGRYGLTTLECQVLRHIDRGCSNEEMAAELGLDRATVKQVVTSMLRKRPMYGHRRQWPDDLS